MTIFKDIHHHKVHDPSNTSKYRSLKVKHHSKPSGPHSGPFHPPFKLTESPYNGVSRNSIHSYKPRDRVIQNKSVNDGNLITGQHNDENHHKNKGHHKHHNKLSKVDRGIEHTSKTVVNTTHKDLKKLVSGEGVKSSISYSVPLPSFPLF